MRCGLVSIDRLDLIEMALCSAQQRVRHLFVARMEIREVLVIRERLLVSAVVEIGVRDLEQGFLFVFAVGYLYQLVIILVSIHYPRYSYSQIWWEFLLFYY